jgi:hypothetical protein
MRRLGRRRHRKKYNIKMGLEEVGLGTWSGFMWLRIETGGGLYETFGFHIIRGIP